MPRLLGVDIPNDRPTVISLTYLYGVGPKIARELCHKAGVNPQAQARELGEDEVARLAALLGQGLHRRRSASPAGEHRTFRGCATSPATAACGIAAACRSAASAPAPTPAPARARRRRRRQEGRQGSALTHTNQLPQAHLFACGLAKTIQQPNRSISHGQKSKPKKKARRNVTVGIAYITGDVQQHDRHDHRHQGRHALLGQRRHQRLQGKPQEHAVRRPDGRAASRREGHEVRRQGSRSAR